MFVSSQTFFGLTLQPQFNIFVIRENLDDYVTMRFSDALVKFFQLVFEKLNVVRVPLVYFHLVVSSGFGNSQIVFAF